MSKVEKQIPRRKFLRILSGALMGLALSAPFSFRALASENADPNLQQWEKLPDSEKERVLQNYNKFKAMQPNDQAELQAALEHFEKMSPSQKTEVEENFKLWNTLAPAEKNKIRTRFAQWKEMPEGARELLQKNSKNWDKLSEKERQQILDQVYQKSAK